MVADATEIEAMESTAACDIEALEDIAWAVNGLYHKDRDAEHPNPARAVLLRDYERLLRHRITQLKRDAEMETTA